MSAAVDSVYDVREIGLSVRRRGPWYGYGKPGLYDVHTRDAHWTKHTIVFSKQSCETPIVAHARKLLARGAIDSIARMQHGSFEASALPLVNSMPN
jgi:hypothetical protein